MLFFGRNRSRKMNREEVNPKNKLKKLRSFRLLYLHWLESQHKLKMLKLSFDRAHSFSSFLFFLSSVTFLRLGASTHSSSPQLFFRFPPPFFGARERTTTDTRNQFILFFYFLLRVSFLFTHSLGLLNVLLHSWTVSHHFDMNFFFADVGEPSSWWWRWGNTK